MAAPTPVSSLVHSSTLVTAGVYLIFRFFPRLFYAPIRLFLIVMGGLTMLMAGMAAIQEIDIKKIVALSTLSQLGVIITSLGAGLFTFAYFHMLSHAFFKALLFMTVGAIIHISRDYQDLRKIRLASNYCYLTLRLRLAANLSLCGMPFISGFYSKDLCIEIFAISDQSVLAISIFFIATALTAAYTTRFILMVYLRTNRTTPYNWVADKDAIINLSILGLYPLSVVGGCLLR
ncbi:UNVERIFIED_CONTAM: hypothetical protein GTU68_046818 [Idotea baltica]|nr:hypothetical protein [Idotea baltica]